jgi:hypothetical protein
LRRRSRALHVCDFGSGFGDIADSLLANLANATLSPSACALDLVDSDERLATYAERRLSAVPWVAARAVTPDQFFASPLKYDAIFGAHVLYYLTDRSRAISILANRLSTRGILSLIVRSERCATFAIRTTVRTIEDDREDPPARPPRITDNMIAIDLAALGLAVSVESLKSAVRVPKRDVDFAALYTGDPSTEATEFIRFLAHFPLGALIDPVKVSAVLDHLDAWLTADEYVLNLESTVITAVRGPRDGPPSS